MADQPVILASPDKLRRLAELRELKRRREVERLKTLDVFTLIGYVPHAKQQEFHASTESDVLYGGSAGGGKSAALVAEGLRACARLAGLRVLLIRRTYDELEESIFPNLRKFGMGEAVGGRWNGTARELRFTNGSIFRFRYLDTLEDASKRQGGEYQLLLVDELCLMAPGVVDILRFERLRAAGDLPVLGVRCTSNPGGPSHAEVKDRYIDATDYGAKTVTDEHGLSVRFIPARASDNPHLDHGYRARLDSIPDPARRRAMRDGDWDQFAGMMFKEYNHDRHTLDPIAVPAQWTRYTGTDWGYAAPYANIWAAVDEDARVWIFRERYATQVGEADQAKQILEAEDEGETVAARFADDAMWATRGDAKPIATVYAENGVHLTPAGKGPGSRVTGWQRWHSYMADGPACPHHRSQGWASCPMVHIFRTCTNLIKELRSLPYATTGNVEDAAAGAPDHAMDASRYLLMNLGGGPKFPIIPEDTPSPLEGIEVLRQVGQWAIREDPEIAELIAAGALTDAQEMTGRPGATQPSPFV